ncbi:MAG: MarR family transcriptional regulator [Ruminococcus sp.]|nr:MarR family transcriptional regulator [Ruminococcus sp.]
MEQKEHIGREIKRLDNEIKSLIASHRMEMGNSDMTLMHNWIACYLYENSDKDVFQKDLEAKFSIARSTASGILQLMEKKGFIERVSVERDARLKKIILTEKGVVFHKQNIQLTEEFEYLMKKGISQEELEIFFRVVRTMRENLEREHSETDRRRERC